MSHVLLEVLRLAATATIPTGFPEGILITGEMRMGKLVVLALVLVSLFVAWIFVDHAKGGDQNDPGQNAGNSEMPNSPGSHRTRREGARSSRKSQSRELKGVEDPEVSEVLSYLKNLEKGRSQLVLERKAKGSDDLIFVFSLAKVSDAGIEEIRRKISEIEGYRENRDGEVELWSSYLLKAFFVDHLSKDVRISMTFDVQSQIVKYHVNIFNQLTRRGKRLPGGFALAQRAGDGWRFDHLLEFDQVVEVVPRSENLPENGVGK